VKTFMLLKARDGSPEERVEISGVEREEKNGYWIICAEGEDPKFFGLDQYESIGFEPKVSGS
jgi:hypothetical protein